jgi:hypothetical protein
MRAIHHSILFTLFFLHKSNCQKTGFFDVWEKDKISKEFIKINHPDSIEVDIISNNDIRINKFHLFLESNNTINKFLSQFKKPIEIVDLNGELNDTKIKIVNYKFGSFYFFSPLDHEKSIYLFADVSINNNSSIEFYLNSKKIKIGDKIEILKKIYPKSYKTYLNKIKKTNDCNEFIIQEYNFNKMIKAKWEFIFCVKNGIITSFSSRTEE